MILRGMIVDFMKGKLARDLGGVASLIALLLFTLNPSRAQLQPGTPSARTKNSVVSALTHIVEQHGWVAKMGRMCAAMNLQTVGECTFKQVALSGAEPGVIDNYGFNVPAQSGSERPYVVLFHLGPLVADFFVVTPDGTLLSSFYRAKGVDFTEIPPHEAGKAFAASLSFWSDNLSKLREMIAAGNAPRR